MRPETPTPAPAARVLWRGRRVRGSVDGYELRAPLAGGSSGAEPIWAATVRGRFGCGQPVAIKAVQQVAVDDLGGREAFLDQAYVSSLIRHPNVAQVLDFGVDAELLYVVTEWVEGDTLQNLSRAARPFGGVPLDLTLRILADACAGLHAAHEVRDASGGPQEPLYGDISPSSLFVSIHGEIKLANFGLVEGDARSCGVAHGTRRRPVAYLSPEQVLRRTLDRRSDIFSMGTVLYRLVTGRHPFRGDDVQATLRNIVSASPAAARTITPWIGRSLEAIIVRALRREPNERFSTALELRIALLEALAEIGRVEPEDIGAFVCMVFGDRFASVAAAPRRGVDSSDDGDDDDEQTLRRPAFVRAAQPSTADPLAASGVYPIVDEPEIALDENEHLQGLLRDIARDAAAAPSARELERDALIEADDTAAFARRLGRSRLRAKLVVVAALLAAISYLLLATRPAPPEPASIAPMGAASPPAAISEPPPVAPVQREAKPATPAQATSPAPSEAGAAVAPPGSRPAARSPRTRVLARPRSKPRAVAPRASATEAAPPAAPSVERPPKRSSESAPAPYQPTDL